MVFSAAGYITRQNHRKKTLPDGKSPSGREQGGGKGKR